MAIVNHFRNAPTHPGRSRPDAAAGRNRRAAHLRVALAIVLACALADAPASAQDEKPQADPRDQTLIVPKTGIVRRGQGQRVTVTDRDAHELTALVHAEVGDRRLVILPGGRLESVMADQTEPTSERFRPATKEEIAAELKLKGLAKFKTRATARYVYVYNTSEDFYKGTSRILETMYPAILAYFKRLKIPVHDPPVPLVAVMFRTEEEFQKFEPIPQGVAAYYSGVTNHIVMYEQSKLVEVAPELAVRQAIGTIAHEGIHQILHNIGVQERLSVWPLWTSEGLAEYFAPTSVDKRLRWKGVGVPNDLRMHELQKFLAQPARERGQMVEQTVGAARLTSAGYAAAWGLTHYLASRQKEKFHAYLHEVARLGPLEPAGASAGAAESKKLFVQFFGSDFGAIEDALVKHLQGLPYSDPIANQTHYVVLLDTAAMRSASVTSSPAAVRKWQEETLIKIPPAGRARANFRIMPFANRVLAEEFARNWLQAN